MTIDMAKQVDICDILDRLGEKCATRGSSESWYYAPKREENTPSFHVYKNGTRWHDFGIGQGGDIIDLVKYLFTISTTREALMKFEDIYSGVSSRFSLPGKEKETLKSKGYNNNSDFKITTCELTSNLLMYSRSRGIHDTVIKRVCKQVNFTTRAGSRLYAIGFKNDNGGWEVRNTFYKGCLGEKSITSQIDLADAPIVIFEGFFDYLSCIELEWIDPVFHNAVVLNSTSMVDKAINFFFSRQLILCLDNDTSGIAASNKIKSCCNVVDDWSSRYHGYKDTNEYLMR